MTAENEEVKEFVERVEVKPAEGDDEPDESGEETPGESSEQKEPEGEEPEEAGDEGEKEPEDEGTESEKIVTPKGNDSGGIKRIPGETPREFALRQEIDRLRRGKRKEKADELLGDQPKAPGTKRELSPERKALLAKYKPEELEALREVIPALAEEMGLVSEDQLNVKSVVEKSNQVFETFMEEHPEYSEENDPDGTLWNALKNEYGLYAKPSDPKQLKKILERAHREVFGIQPEGALKKVNAAEEKVKVASHGSHSKAEGSVRKNSENRIKSTGARLDMLQGFTDEEKAEMAGSEE